MSTPDDHDWLSAAVTMGVAGLGAVWWMVRHIFSSVTRKELKEHLDQMRADRFAMHQENLGRFEQLENAIGAVHQRIDTLYRDRS